MPLQTGLKVVAALIPIGRGQRELIVGDRQTGKTAIAIDTILNQRGQNVVCVYCAIGQRASAVAKAVAILQEKKAMDYTVVVVTEGNDPPGLAYIAPYSATSIGEHFMEAGRDVLIVYDDLTHHARAYRELCLLLRRPPGRGAFPGDIFYIHSRLLERATHLRQERGGGSDQGLVGQFNDVVADFAVETLAALPGKFQVWAVGERVHARLADAGLPLVGLFTVPNSVKTITPLVGQILVESEARRGQAELFALHLFYNRPASGAVYAPVNQQLLPLDEAWRRERIELPWPAKSLPEVMGVGTETLRALIREYLFVSLFRACAESLASENASRLAAMERADKNIDELLETLQGTFHRLRQSSIDEELFDVISGFEALSSERRPSAPGG